MRLRLGAVAVVILVFTLNLDAKKKAAPKVDASNFDYYLLSLSYAPDFCAQSTGIKDPVECGAGRQTAFVVHGLWPQSESGRGPEKCAPASPVSSALISTMLRYMPSASLIQHEWAMHGVCSGLSVSDYFAAVRKARESVTIPAGLDRSSEILRLRSAEIESKLAAANPRFPSGAFRLSCYRTGELQEVRVCFAKDLSPRACSSNAGTCPLMMIMLLPVR